jgi:hypothetical protein
MASLTNGPSGASREPQCFGLLVECKEPADLTASASSLILEDCRPHPFILAVGGSGRWVRACTRATEDGRNTSERVIVDVPRRLDRAVDQAVEVAGTVVGGAEWLRLAGRRLTQPTRQSNAPR